MNLLLTRFICQRVSLFVIIMLSPASLLAEPAEISWKQELRAPIPKQRPLIPAWLSAFRSEFQSMIGNHHEQIQLHQKAQAAMQDLQPDPQGFELFGRTANQGDHRAGLRASLKAFSEGYIKGFSLIRDLTQGIHFDIDLSQSKDTHTGPSTHANRGQQARYGLILTNIEPSSESRPLAQRGPIDHHQLSQATQAKLHWSIARIEAERPIFTPYQVQQRHSSPRAQTLWQGLQNGSFDFSFLDADFDGKIINQGQALTPDQILASQTFILRQKSNFYQMHWPMQYGLPKGQPNHQFLLPLSDRARYQLHLDGALQTNYASLSVKLSQQHELWWHLHQYKKESRWKSEWSYHRGLTKIGFISELPGERLPQSFGVNPAEKYELQLALGF